jgi:hypothetical protein
LQLLQALTPEDHNLRHEYCLEFQEHLQEKADKLVFSDEVCFHLSGKVNRHNMHIWGTENPRTTVQHVSDSPKVNVFCAISSRRGYGPFFFAEKNFNGFAYLDMLQLWLLPQLQEDSDNFILEHDGAPPHFHLEVRRHLSNTLCQRWIERMSKCNEDSALNPWAPMSPDLTPCDFFLWGYVEDNVYVPPLPKDLPELRQRIVAAVGTIYVDILQCVWQELDYRIDVCRDIRVGHMEHL